MRCALSPLLFPSISPPSLSPFICVPFAISPFIPLPVVSHSPSTYIYMLIGSTTVFVVFVAPPPPPPPPSPLAQPAVSWGAQNQISAKLWLLTTSVTYKVVYYRHCIGLFFNVIGFLKHFCLNIIFNRLSIGFQYENIHILHRPKALCM